MRDSYPQSLSILLKESNLESNTLQTIKQRAQVLIKLNNTVISLLPIELKTWCRVANYSKHILILEVTNASRKVRLNYELPTLLSTLRNTILPFLSSINIIINPSLSSKNSKNSKNFLLFQQIAIKPSKQIINQLSKESANKIRNLAKRSPKKLKEKLERLAALAEENTKAASNKDWC